MGALKMTITVDKTVQNIFTFRLTEQLHPHQNLELQTQFMIG